jgi:hypothetical protein
VVLLSVLGIQISEVAAVGMARTQTGTVLEVMETLQTKYVTVTTMTRSPSLTKRMARVAAAMAVKGKVQMGLPEARLMVTLN